MKEKEFRRHPKVIRIIGVAFLGITFAVLFALVFGFLVKILWNALMPELFGLTRITYWQAFGLLILTKLLFGSFGHHHSYRNHDRLHKKVEDRWHRFLGVAKDEEDDDLWKPKGSHQNWKYYKQYWKDEGKAAFEAYIEKIEAEEKKKE